MIPDSLRRVIAQNAAPRGDITTIWRDGTVIRESHRGEVKQLPSIPALPDQDDDNPFPP